MDFLFRFEKSYYNSDGSTPRRDEGWILNHSAPIYFPCSPHISIILKTKHLLLINIKDLVVYPGAELPVIEAIKLGAPGCISATANLNSKNIGEVIRLSHSGNWNEAERLHQNVKKVRLLFQDYGPIPAQKAILAMKTKNDLWNNIRPPLQRISKEKADALALTLNKFYGFSF